MNRIPPKNRPETQFSLTEIHNKQYKFPIIIKPIICTGDGKNVTIIYSSKELQLFLKNCKNTHLFMVQNYLYNYNIELGVLWEKYPWENEGKIVEIVEKTQKTPMRVFIPNSFKNHNHLINNQLNNTFNEISKRVKNMNVCRYDIRLKNINDLETNKFKILEINGTMGMSFLGFPIKYGVFRDIRWYCRRLIIGLVNILTLQGYSPVNLIIVMYKSYLNAILCEDWENIYSLYS